MDDARRRERRLSARREACRSCPHPARDARQRDPQTAQRHRAPARPRRHLHSARRPRPRHAFASRPRRVSRSFKPRRGIFRRGLRRPEPRTRILPAACAKAPEPTRPRAAQRASPAASISRTSTRRIFRASQSSRRSAGSKDDARRTRTAWPCRRAGAPCPAAFRACPLRARGPATGNGRAMRVA